MHRGAAVLLTLIISTAMGWGMPHQHVDKINSNEMLLGCDEIKAKDN